VQICVREVLDGKMTENKAIAKMQDNDLELKRQKEMYKSNIECRNKISKKKLLKNSQQKKMSDEIFQKEERLHTQNLF
jgi:hypothetical protein